MNGNQANFLMVGDTWHCFGCHRDYPTHTRNDQEKHLCYVNGVTPYGCEKCAPHNPVACHHVLKHTERLIKNGTQYLEHCTYVIETHCADCGKFLKQVDCKP